MRELENPIQPYAWGSRSAIARLQGRPVPSDQPEAELWLGAHPVAPSRLVTNGSSVPLTDAVAADPARLLGEAARTYGARLPYLLKVLAAERALSLQVHPDADQARAGYAAEEAAGVPIGDKKRNYVDPYHKPELLVALTEFRALCGFRDPDRSAKAIESLEVAELGEVVSTLRSGSVAERLRGAMRLLLRWPAGDRSRLVSAVAAGARRADLQLPVELAAAYPTDPGVVVALLLNEIRLHPGEAIFMPAGNLHAYLGGLGVEIMAASDNVLRCGLTPKHIDVAEATRVLRYEVLDDPVVPERELGRGLVTWPVPVAEFALVRARPDNDVVVLPGGGPRIVACVAGQARVRCGAAEKRLASGHAVFVGADEPPVEVSGVATVVFQAAPNN